MNNKNILLLLLFISSSLLARQRTGEEMIQIAKMTLSQTATRGVSSQVKLLDETDVFAVYGDSESFAVISKDDCHKPVWGYSFTSYDKSSMPCGFQWWLSQVKETMQTRAAIDQLDGFEPEVIAPLIKSTWGQGDPFNYLCPTLGGRRGVTGCVATATSQILRYYRYPSVSNGRGYYTLGENASPMYVNVHNEYKWDLLKDSYASAWFLTDDEKNAIAQLMYDAGVASHMNYASDGSGATVFEAANGLAQVFQMDSLAMKCVGRSYCKDDVEWLNIIKQELKNNHPLLMAAQSPTGGHAFVLDGMDADGKIHINWGWDGKFDGYFEFNNLNPSSYHYDSKQYVVTNLRLDPTPTEDEEFHSCWVLSVEDDIQTDMLNGLTIMADNGILWQNSHMTFYGKLGVAFFDENNNEIYFHTMIDTSDKKNGFSPVYGGHGFYVSYFSKITVSDIANIPAGKYRVFLASKAVQDKTPQFICYPGGKHNEYTLVKSEDNTLTISKSETSSIHSLKASTSTNGSYYNLQGHDFGTSKDALPKGIYIIGGKKVLK